MQRKSFIEVEGTVNKIGDLTTIQLASGKTFSRRIVEIIFGSDEYPTDVAIEFAGKNVDLPLQFKVGENRTFKCNLRAYRTKIGDLVTSTPSCWASDILGAEPKKAAPVAATAEGEDLPF